MTIICCYKAAGPFVSVIFARKKMASYNLDDVPLGIQTNVSDNVFVE